MHLLDELEPLVEMHQPSGIGVLIIELMPGSANAIVPPTDDSPSKNTDVEGDVHGGRPLPQCGALSAVASPQEPKWSMLVDDRANRDLMVKELGTMRGVRCPMPEETLYAFPFITSTALSSQSLAERLLHEADLVVEAGRF